MNAAEVNVSHRTFVTLCYEYAPVVGVVRCHNGRVDHLVRCHGRLRPLALASSLGRERPPQLGARASGAIAARTPGCDAHRIGDGRGASELKGVLVGSLDLLRLDDPAIEEARLVAGNRDVPWLLNLPHPRSTVAQALASVAFRTPIGLRRRLHARQRSRPREPAHQLVAGRTLGRVVVDEVLGCPAFILRTSLSISRQVSHST